VLKSVAHHHRIVSLSANQIGLSERVFVALKPELMVPGRWRGYDEVLKGRAAEEVYEGIVGAVEESSSETGYYGFEECPSFEGLRFKVKIPLLINIRYIAEKTLLGYLANRPK
jgi:peptide deformylase